MSKIQTSESLLKSMAKHGDTDRLLNECHFLCNRLEEVFRPEESITFYFDDGSSLLISPDDDYITAYTKREALP